MNLMILTSLDNEERGDEVVRRCRILRLDGEVPHGKVDQDRGI